MSTDKKNQRAFKLTRASPPPAHTTLFNTLLRITCFVSLNTLKQNEIQKRTKNLRYSKILNLPYLRNKSKIIIYPHAK